MEAGRSIGMLFQVRQKLDRLEIEPLELTDNLDRELRQRNKSKTPVFTLEQMCVLVPFSEIRNIRPGQIWGRE